MIREPPCFRLSSRPMTRRRALASLLAALAAGCRGDPRTQPAPNLGPAPASTSPDPRASFARALAEAPPETAALLRTLDGVPSYNAGWAYDPLPVIQAVNALHPLGKDRALAAIEAYLRAADPEAPGREGVFLVLRSLFDVPRDTRAMPPMRVGAPTPAVPANPRAVPCFPLSLGGDVPLLLIEGYTLGGHPEGPEEHVAYFRRHGVVRRDPLHPVDDPTALVEDVVQAGLWPDSGRYRVLLINQILRMLRTVRRVSVDAQGMVFAFGADAESRWKAERRVILAVGLRWDPRGARYTRKDGSVLGG
jgi:hypothetical protein